MAIRRIRYQQQDFVLFLFFSFLFFFFCFVDYASTHKEKKREGTFGGGPGGDPSDTAVAGGLAVVGCMYGRMES